MRALINYDAGNKKGNSACAADGICRRQLVRRVHFLSAARRRARRRTQQAGSASWILERRLLCQPEETLSIRPEKREAVDRAARVGEGRISVHLLRVPGSDK